MKCNAGLEVRFLSGNVEDGNAQQVETLEVYTDNELVLEELYTALEITTRRFVKRRQREIQSGYFFCNIWPEAAKTDGSGGL